MDTGLASVIGALSTTGLEAYEVSTGAPVSINSLTPGAVTNIGTAAQTTALLPIILIAAFAVVAIYVFGK